MKFFRYLRPITLKKLKNYKPRFKKENRALCNSEYNDPDLGESVNRLARCSRKCSNDWTYRAFQYYPPNKKCYFLKEEEPVIEADIPKFQCVTIFKVQRCWYTLTKGITTSKT